MSRRLAVCWSALLLGLSVSAAHATTCSAESGPERVRLLELYTSEGCSSCPPADRWLSKLRTAPAGSTRVAPLALHVDYWNRLGWTDRFSSAAHTERQYRLARDANSRLVYTPQFVLDGRDWRPDGASVPASPRPAGAGLRLVLDESRPHTLEVAATVRLKARTANAGVVLVLHENDLVTRVRSGENAGRQLRHDYVVRRMVGPIPVSLGDAQPVRASFALAADWKRRDLGVTAFVQDGVSGEILQALQMPVCTPG